MPIPIMETCRKRKRKPKVYGLHRFGEPSFPISRTGVFRDDVRVFLRECAELEDYNVQGMPVRCTLLHHETKGCVIPLYTIEQDVKYSAEPYCDHCRCTGWSNHFVSKRKYHLIIPSDTEWNMPLDNDACDLQTHLLYGLIHSNGFGHLICINGMEGGSRHLCGREVMDLWDHICTMLGARMITVEDLSKKQAMDLRLLYGVAYGHSWFGRWGYKFCRGSYGVTKENYENAIEFLGCLGLDQIALDFRNEKQHREIEQIFRHYREMSEGQLITFRDLLRFLLTIKPLVIASRKRLPLLSSNTFFPIHISSTSRSILKKMKNNNAANETSPKYKRYSNVAASLGSRWPMRRLEYAAQVIVKSLKEMKAMGTGKDGMTRQDVRDAARLHIGDTGLLDYVLKSMNNVIVGDVVVRRAVDPTTRILQYTIQQLDNDDKVIEPEKEIVPVYEERIVRMPFTSKPKSDVQRDLFFLYKNVLLNYPGSESVSSATQAVLDSKHFVKEWPFWDDTEKGFRFCCRINPSLVDMETELPPWEFVALPLQATVSDLKQAIEGTFRETYSILENFVATEIEELGEGVEDDELLFGRIESGSDITVRGFGIDLESNLKCQGGCETWMVRCPCGADDDDGERMVACDVCEVWQHTRCYEIEDSENLPPLFVCSSCCDSFADQQRRRLLEPKLEFLQSCSDDLLLPEEGLGYKESLRVMFSSETGIDCNEFVFSSHL